MCAYPHQDGMFQGSQAPTKFVQQFMLFWREFDFNVFSIK